MKSKIIRWLLIAVIVCACSPTKNTITIVPPGDGRSFETAVLIQETSESAGIHAEYQWIRDHYTDYKVAQQALVSHKKKPFDVITIQFSDERKQDIYFDISKFFK